MKRVLIPILAVGLIVAALPSCKKVATDASDDIFTRGAEVIFDGVTLNGAFASSINPGNLSEVGFLVSEKNKFAGGDAKKFTVEIPEDGSFKRVVTAEELDEKRDIPFYYKAYVIEGGKLKTGEQRSFRLDPIAVSSISLDKATAGCKKGATVQLEATVGPANATHPDVSWESSDTKIATVSKTGLVKGIAKGQVDITATAGEKSATCLFTVRGDCPTGFKDLGVSVYWAEKNLEASKPSDAGEYFRFGEVNTQADFNSTYDYPDYDPETMYYIINQYNDAATYRNKLWRMPSRDEFEELVANCDLTSETLDGITGIRLTSKTTGQSIFLSSETGEMYLQRQLNQPYHKSYGPYGFYRSRTGKGPYGTPAILEVNANYKTASIGTWGGIPASVGIPIRAVSEGE